jgi:hypothetical protein
MENARQDGPDVVLPVRVQPKASRDAISGGGDGRIRVALTAPPVEGAANAALCIFLAKRFGVAKSRVTVESGLKSREKTVRIRDISLETVTKGL